MVKAMELCATWALVGACVWRDPYLAVAAVVFALLALVEVFRARTSSRATVGLGADPMPRRAEVLTGDTTTPTLAPEQRAKWPWSREDET